PGKRVFSRSGFRFVQPYQLAGITKRQGPQQHRINDAEDSCIGANPQRQGQRRNCRESTRLSEYANRIPDVLPPSTHFHACLDVRGPEKLSGTNRSPPHPTNQLTPTSVGRTRELEAKPRSKLAGERVRNNDTARAQESGGLLEGARPDTCSEGR